jgi:hypothetical protein
LGRVDLARIIPDDEKPSAWPPEAVLLSASGT